MIPYLMLGIGVLLVLISVIYTHQVDKRVNTQEETKLGEHELYKVTQTTPHVMQVSEKVKVAQVKASVGNIGDELDILIEELREKETEVKQIVRKVKDMHDEISTPNFSKILTEKIASTSEEIEVESVISINQTDTTEQVETTPGTPQPIKNEPVGRYEQIGVLLEEGLSVEEIARKLNMGLREVELFVKVRQKGARNGA